MVADTRQSIMKRTISVILFLIATVHTLHLSAAISLQDETLRYKVMYKWGLINSQAGNATLTLKSDGKTYKAMLAAASEPWADRIYKVRDTLLCTMEKDSMFPIRYEKIAHEDGKYNHDVIKYTRDGNLFTGHCSRFKRKKDNSTSSDSITLQATGTTVDMLSVYYYLRALDFKAMTVGQTITINIFSGKRKELLRLKYRGNETVKIDKTPYQCYRVSFTFTSDGKTKTSDDMEAWISIDSRRIPVKLEGKLPVGKIRCLYTGE